MFVLFVSFHFQCRPVRDERGEPRCGGHGGQVSRIDRRVDESIDETSHAQHSTAQLSSAQLDRDRNVVSYLVTSSIIVLEVHISIS